MRLNTGGVRELHWHKAAEWSYMLYGKARITGVDANGRNFVDDVGVGDLWYFPSGIPHSIQGLEPDGAEFLLVFDDGDFDEDNTFLLSDWIKHIPPEVLAKNFGVQASAFANVPDPSQLYIFPAPVPGPLASDKIAGATEVPRRFSHRMMAQTPIKTKSGTVRITDSKVFPASTTIAAALVEGGRDARAALAPEYGRMAILHRGAGTHGRVWSLGPGSHLRFPGQRCGFRAVCDGALHREHRQYDAAILGNLQERLLR
jgi:oxalate decarboxylase